MKARARFPVGYGGAGQAGLCGEVFLRQPRCLVKGLHQWRLILPGHQRRLFQGLFSFVEPDDKTNYMPLVEWPSSFRTGICGIARQPPRAAV